MRQATEEAARSLREEILSGRLAAGSKIAETDLARRLSVSRTPVREALSRLSAEGLVELSPNKGARVTTWSADELREIFHVRLLLEPPAVREAVRRMGPDELAELDELARAMQRAGRSGARQDLDAVVNLNRRFHGLLAESAGNRALVASLRAVTHAAVVHQNFHHYSPGALKRSLAHHVEIVEAARAGEPDWAAAVMRAHLYNARSTMLGSDG